MADRRSTGERSTADAHAHLAHHALGGSFTPASRPSTAITCPVIHPASGDTRNAARAATSSGSPTRPSGCIASEARMWPRSRPGAGSNVTGRVRAPGHSSGCHASRTTLRRDHQAVDATLCRRDRLVVEEADPSGCRRKEDDRRWPSPRARRSCHPPKPLSRMNL